MIYFWIALAILDVLIIFFIIITCMVSMRRAPNDVLQNKFDTGSTMELIQRSIAEEKHFFITHPGELVVIEANGVQLAARHFKQEHPAGRIILFHGYRSVAENDFCCAMQSYYDQGLEILLVDQRAHGKSSGMWIGFGVLERYDCLAWIRYMNDTHGELPTFLSGISMGCTTVLMALGLPLPKNVRGVIADCGFTSPKEIVLHVMKKRLHFNPSFLMPAISLFHKIFAGYFLGEYSTIDAVKQTDIPIIFIHGTADHFVPCSMTERNYEACASEKRLVLVEGAGHGTSFLVDRERVENEVSSFIADHSPATL